MDPSIYFIAFSGGLLSFLTPCNLINLLSFISYATAEGKSMKRGFFLSIVFGLGFSLTFSAIGLALIFVPGFILKQVWLQVVGGIIIMVIGVLMAIGVFKKRPKNLTNPEESSNDIQDNNENFAAPSENSLPTYSRSFILGVSLSTAGIACALPILIAVITAIATSADQIGGFLALFLYAFGMIIPFVFIGLGLGKINEFLVLKLVKITSKLQIIFGIILIILGFYLMYTALVILGIW